MVQPAMMCNSYSSLIGFTVNLTVIDRLQTSLFTSSVCTRYRYEIQIRRSLNMTHMLIHRRYFIRTLYCENIGKKGAVSKYICYMDVTSRNIQPPLCEKFTLFFTTASNVVQLLKCATAALDVSNFKDSLFVLARTTRIDRHSQPAHNMRHHGA